MKMKNEPPRVCGVIAEYNPFHNGHAHQLAWIKSQAQAEYCIVVLGSAFGQRGSPCLVSTQIRAAMALENGADLVLQMPAAYGMQQANQFAMGGVGVLHSLGCVDALCFGVEPQALPLLRLADEAMQSEAYAPAVQAALKQGASFAKAQGSALSHLLGAEHHDRLNRPNFNLALCYAQAIRALDSSLALLPMERAGDYHATGMQSMPSATAVRLAITRGDWPAVRHAVPLAVFDLIQQEALHGRLAFPDAMSTPVLYALHTAATTAMRHAPEISEGLENRVKKMLLLAADLDALVTLCKSKRYPEARIRRALTQIWLGLDKSVIPQAPPYARLIGYRKEALPLLSRIKKTAAIPLVSKTTGRQDALAQFDLHTEAAWRLICRQNIQAAYTAQVIIK